MTAEDELHYYQTWRTPTVAVFLKNSSCIGNRLHRLLAAINTAERLPLWLGFLMNSIAQYWPRVTYRVRQSYEASWDPFMPPRHRWRSRYMMGWLKNYRAQLNSAYRARNDVIWLWTWEWCFNSLWFNKPPLVQTSFQAHGEISTGLFLKSRLYCPVNTGQSDCDLVCLSIGTKRPDKKWHCWGGPEGKRHRSWGLCVQCWGLWLHKTISWTSLLCRMSAPSQTI